MNVRRLGLALGLGLLGALATGSVTPAVSDDSERTPEAWNAYQAARLLRRSQWALDNLAFEGREITMTWFATRTVSAIARRSHYRHLDRTDYMAPAKLAGRTLLSDGRVQRDYNPRTHQVFVRPTVTPPALNLGLLRRNYRLVLAPEPHAIADHPCRLIWIRPRHLGKPSRAMWIDLASSLPIKREQYHADGTPASYTQFTEVRIDGPIPRSRFTLQLPPGTRQIVKTPPRIGGSPPTPRFDRELPGGYRFVRSVWTPQVGWQCVYSDGLDIVSVLQAPIPAGHSPRLTGIRVRLGPFNGSLVRHAHQWVVTWVSSRYRFTVIGDLSRDLVLEIAHAVAT